jgi:hypothetical protein
VEFKNDIFVFYFCSLIFFLCRNDQLLVGSMVQELIVGQIERPIQDPRCFVVRIYSKESTVSIVPSPPKFPPPPLLHVVETDSLVSGKRRWIVDDVK